jgi:hypothetical protein
VCSKPTGTTVSSTIGSLFTTWWCTILFCAASLLEQCFPELLRAYSCHLVVIFGTFLSCVQQAYWKNGFLNYWQHIFAIWWGILELFSLAFRKPTGTTVS